VRIHFKSASILILVLAAIIVPLIIFWPASDSAKDDAWAFLPQKLPSTDHSALMKGPYEDGPAERSRDGMMLDEKHTTQMTRR